MTTEPRLRLLEAHKAGPREQIARLRAPEKSLTEKITTYRHDLVALPHIHRQNGTDDD